MGQVTEISWCDSTVNPTSGCDGCELWVPGKKGPCYAGNLHEKRLAKSLPQLYAPDFTEVRLIPGRMAKAARWSDLTGTNRPDKPWFGGGPRVIFIGDMGDTLSKAVPFQFLRTEIIDVVDSPAGRRHVWMWLTKQAARLAEFSAWLLAQDIGWPDNLWPGTSVTRQATLGRAEHLERVGNGDTTRFLSCEPLREELSLLGCLGLAAALGIRGNGDEWGPAYTPFGKSGIGLVIDGGESGPGARRYDFAWSESIERQCAAAGVAYFRKQIGSNAGWTDADGDWHRWPTKDPKGGTPEQWPDRLSRVRQFPNATEVSHA